MLCRDKAVSAAFTSRICEAVDARYVEAEPFGYVLVASAFFDDVVSDCRHSATNCVNRKSLSTYYLRSLR